MVANCRWERVGRRGRGFCLECMYGDDCGEVRVGKRMELRDMVDRDRLVRWKRFLGIGIVDMVFSGCGGGNSLGVVHKAEIICYRKI